MLFLIPPQFASLVHERERVQREVETVQACVGEAAQEQRKRCRLENDVVVRVLLAPAPVITRAMKPIDEFPRIHFVLLLDLIQSFPSTSKAKTARLRVSRPGREFRKPS